MAEEITARELGIRSRAAAHAGDRDGHGKLAFLRSYWEFDALELVEPPPSQ
jgi:hypothetical protein